jgi:FkbM family methyltransferase
MPKWSFSDIEASLWQGDTWGVQNHIREGCKVLDFGANNGLVTALCAVNGAVVTAYEPHPRGYELLLETIRLNEIESRVLAIKAAVWTYTGFLKMNLSVPHGTDSTKYFTSGVTEMCESPNPNNILGYEVKCVSFDEAIGETEWDIVKMDVEGAEYPILLNCSDSIFDRIRFLTIEMHPDSSNTEEKYQQILVKLMRHYTLVTQDRFSIFAVRK